MFQTVLQQSYQTWQLVRRRWPAVVGLDLSFRILAILVFAPLAALVFRLSWWITGTGNLADQEILFFLMRPVGLGTLILGGAIALAAELIKCAGLMYLMVFPAQKRVTLGNALQFAGSRAVPIVRLTIRMIVWALLQLAPLAAVIGGTYLWLLGEFDINYYLAEKPPEFVRAVVIALIVVLLMILLVARLAVNWVLALPILLFENVAPSRALGTSQERVTGHRRMVVTRYIGVLLVMFLASMVGNFVIWLIGWGLLPSLGASLSRVALAIGGLLLASLLVNFFVALVTSVLLTSIQLLVYRQLDGRKPLQQWQANANIPDRGEMRRFRSRTIAGLAALLVLGGVTVGLVVAQINRIPREDRAAVIAHRGASQAAPENSLAAIRAAIAEGADRVEIDVQEIADGSLIVYHDFDFKRLTGSNLKTSESRAEEVAALRIRGAAEDAFPDEGVPTLAEVLEVCRDRVGLTIELKYHGRERRLEAAVAEAVEAAGMASQVEWMSLNYEGVLAMKATRPDWRVGHLLSVSATDLAKSQADFLAFNGKFVSPALVRKVHALGKEVYVWTVNDPYSASRYLSRGVDGLITDLPQMAHEVLEARAELGLAERLLLELADDFGIQPKIADQ